MTPFERATAERDRLDRAAKAAGLALATFPTEGPLGLTPDHVKASTLRQEECGQELRRVCRLGRARRHEHHELRDVATFKRFKLMDQP